MPRHVLTEVRSPQSCDSYVVLLVCMLTSAGEMVDLSDYDYNAVASLLKLYLRELPEPLILGRSLSKMEAATNTCK